MAIKNFNDFVNESVKRKFPTNEPEAGEDVLEWLFDNLPEEEDFDLTKDEQRQLRDASPEEVVNIINSLLSKHKIVVKEKGKYLEISIKKK